ncbi:hypothetical protein H0H81_008419, partial [Sphagnurus paluster]
YANVLLVSLNGRRHGLRNDQSAGAQISVLQFAATAPSVPQNHTRFVDNDLELAIRDTETARPRFAGTLDTAETKRT